MDVKKQPKRFGKYGVNDSISEERELGKKSVYCRIAIVTLRVQNDDDDVGDNNVNDGSLTIRIFIVCHLPDDLNFPFVFSQPATDWYGRMK